MLRVESPVRQAGAEAGMGVGVGMREGTSGSKSPNIGAQGRQRRRAAIPAKPKSPSSAPTSSSSGSRSKRRTAVRAASDSGQCTRFFARPPGPVEEVPEEPAGEMPSASEMGGVSGSPIFALLDSWEKSYV